MRAVLLFSLSLMLTAMAIPGNRRAAKARSATAAGQPFPPFNGTALSGATWNNSLFRDRVTLVSLWRIGCGACMLEMPAYDALLDSIRDQRFQIISMAPQTRDELAAFYSADPHSPIGRACAAMDWKAPRYDVLPMCVTKRFKKAGELGVQCSALEALFGNDGYPVTFVVGPDGVIRHRHEGLPMDMATMRPSISAFRQELDSLLKAL